MRYLLVVFVACSAPQSPRTQSATFADVRASVLADLERFSPAMGVSLGHHQFDGKLPDRSPAGIDAEVVQLRKNRELLGQFDPMQLSPIERDERDTLIQTLRGRLFRLVDLDELRANPMVYADAINLNDYISRDYAPAHERARAVIDLCAGLPAYLAQARKNIRTPVPRPWLDTALLQTRGLAKFADTDVRTEFGKVDVPLANQAQIGPALDQCKAALVEHAAWLEELTKTGTQDFALGTDLFLRMLAETQGIDTDLATLHRVVNDDIARNLDAMIAAAKAIDPSKPVAEVVAAVAADRPSPTEVIAVAQQQTDELRKFILDKRIVSIPTDDVAIVRESPPFMRWNFAFLDSPGPFEQRKLPSFYYVSPPDPAWPEQQQREYVAPRADLLFTTAHEVYPGHFVHSLHTRKNPSPVMQSLGFYTTGEGWAHYAEEMMYDAGAGDHTPQMHIGQLKEALLRDVRFLVALGEHTGSMTVAQAEKLFLEQAFTDAASARQQAVRGTFDPMYLSYTLGKLVIMKLRTDWMRQHPKATLGDFHDEFLSHGSAPLPVIRRAMKIDTPLL